MSKRISKIYRKAQNSLYSVSKVEEEPEEKLKVQINLPLTTEEEATTSSDEDLNI